MDALCEVVSDEDDFHTLISFIFKLSGDPEYVVRMEIVGHVPQIATFCKEHPSDLESVIRQQLVPLIVNHLNDHHTQVRKTSQVSFLALLEKGLVDDRQLTEWICPLGIQLSGSSDEEVRTEAVTLMCRMAPLVGRDITLKYFLEHIASFCVDSAFSVRQVCSMFFGDVCKVVGTEPTESILLQKFLSLCEDSVWGVRKYCADVFMDVSSVVSAETRREILPSAFVSLLCDESRWVRLAAYHSLGAVIATFADPTKTGLKYCEDGSIVEVPIINEQLSESSGESNEKRETCDMDTKVNEVQNSSSRCSSEMNTNVDQSCSLTTSDSSDSTNNSKQTNFPSRTENICDAGLLSDPPVQSSATRDFAGDSVGVSGSHSDEKCNTSDDMPVGMEAGDSVVPTLDAHNGEDHSPQHMDLHQTIAQGSVSLESSSVLHKDGSVDSPLTVVAKDGHLHLHLENENNFNNFQFWRVPIPDLELDIDIQDGKATSIHIRAKIHDEKSDKICASDLSVKIAPNEESSDSPNAGAAQTSLSSAGKLDIQTSCLNTVMDDSSPESGRTASPRVSIVNSSFSGAFVELKQGESPDVQVHNSSTVLKLLEDCDSIFQSRYHRVGFVDKIECDKSAYDQDVVPPQLLEYYVGMVDSIQSQTVDPEITKVCARSFPAVVYTLGRKHWPCLRKLCDALAKDMQWKVRKTIAACLHELGIMLGSKITAKDLLPVFVSFLKDLDEVRMGVLSHLPEFLRLLKPSDRRVFLPLTEEFVKMDNERNWRYRCVLAQQLGPIVDLFSPTDVQAHLAPIGMWLITDKVSEVRLAACRMMAMVLRRLSQTPDAQMAVSFVTGIIQKFSKSTKWHLRQMYVFLCEQLALEKSFPHETYIKVVVSTLFEFTQDPVPNVRIAVARCFANTFIPLDYFPSIQKMFYPELLQAVYSLQEDSDKDVQYFTHVISTAFSVYP